ncbi:MAG: hypothetical protein ACRDV9_11535 [Acidimicrobiia bacterium]
MPDRTDPLDAELRRISAALVKEAPPPPPIPAPGDLTRSVVPARPGWRVAIGVSLVAVFAVTGAFVVAGRPSDDGRSAVSAGPSTATSTAPPPPEPGPTLTDDRLIVRQNHQEVLRDGTLTTLPIPPDIATQTILGLPDGRLVILGTRDLMPGVARRDGADVAGVAVPLVVTTTDGTVLVDRDVRERGRSVSLLAASSTEAILYRSEATRYGGPIGGGRLVAHDLATGAERALGRLTHTPRSGDIVGSALLVVSAAATGDYATPGPCRVDVVPLDGTIGPQELAAPDCFRPYDVDPSPDGRYAAVAYQDNSSDNEPEVRLAIIELEGGRLLSDESLGNPVICPPDQCGGLEPFGYLGAAWLDPTTLRIARNDLRVASDDRVSQESLHLLSRTVPD